MQWTFKPGQRDLRKLSEEYGEQILCVRYHYDQTRWRWIKTVELIIEDVPKRPHPTARKKTALVGVRVSLAKVE